jgi:hypothetical protein
VIRADTTVADLDATTAGLTLLANGAGLDGPVERAATRILAELAARTPRRWTGATRRAWTIKNTGDGQRLIWNTLDGSTPNKVFLFLAHGTAQGGSGYIYPRSKKALFIPLTARAAQQGWNPGLVRDVDYILRKRVRGIRPRRIAADFVPRAQAILREEVNKFLQQMLP